MAKSILKLKEKDKATFFSSSVDTVASMHRAEQERLRFRRNGEPFEYPETLRSVITVNGEVQTNEEATVYFYDSDLFLTVQIHEDTPAVLSFGKLAKIKETLM